MLRLEHITTEGPALDTARQLFRDYANELNADLCFQSFEKELANPLSKYGAPKGSLIMAHWNQEPVATIALQALPEEGVCEMKRMYVQPAFRRLGIGEELVKAILNDAEKLGYTTMKLDTLDRLVPAIRLYEKHGFALTTAYYANPLPGVVYMEKTLR